MSQTAELSLFEKISGHFSDGTPISQVRDSARRPRSIRDHLQRLLNTRRGSLAHLPLYGLSDVSDMYRKLPSSGMLLEREIQEVISLYEPRLSQPRAQMLPFDPADARVRFRITAYMHGTRIQLHTDFTAIGRSSVELDK